MRSSNSITRHEVSQPVPVFLEALTSAIPHLKNRLQQNYAQAYPDLADIIEVVIEAEAWRLAPLFPHLVLPGLVGGHVAQLGLQVVDGRPDNVSTPAAFAGTPEHLTQAVGQFS